MRQKSDPVVKAVRLRSTMRIQARRGLGIAFCGLAILSSWLAFRLRSTYLPAQTDYVVDSGTDLDEITATIQSTVGDLGRLEELACKTARAVYPSVVAVRNRTATPSSMTPYQNDYASGVIISADGLVLSQWHVSHMKAAEGDTVAALANSTTRVAGDRTVVILHDGRECVAELLGASRTHDISLLRLIEPGPYPHTPIPTAASIDVGDWVLKFGHPFGYRKDRPAPARLGRVIAGTQDVFYTDCMLAGGDSGGPYFNLDGQLLGIVRNGDGALRLMQHDPSFSRRIGASNLYSVTGYKLIGSCYHEMLNGEIPSYDVSKVRGSRDLASLPQLRAADYSQGSATLAQYRSIANRSCSSVVVVLNAGVAVSLGTIVASEGLALTKASELPDKPSCRLTDGKVVAARVIAVDRAFDLALLDVSATKLKPVQWSSDFNPDVGTLLAAVGPDEPVALGIVSVPRRDLPGRVPHHFSLPLRLAPGGPEIYGRFQPKSGYSLRAAMYQPRSTVYHVGDVFGLAWSAGVRPSDLLISLNNRPILAEEDLLDAIKNKRTGDVVPVRVERSGRLIDLRLPLTTATTYTEHSYRADDFPTVIECAVPFYAYECGGPVVDLSGRAVGVTIARVGPHGGMIIPGDRVQELLQVLKSNKSTGTWTPSTE